MKKIKLLFPSRQSLLLFKETTHANYIAINEHDNTLICECSETDIRMAMKKFNATILESCTDEKKENLV